MKRPKISIAEQMYAAGIWERPIDPWAKDLRDAIVKMIAELLESLGMLKRSGIVFSKDQMARIKAMKNRPIFPEPGER
jgi:hypothetical protein